MINFKNFIKDIIYIDLYLFISITLLSIMGLVFLYSASQGNIETIIKQSFFVIFGLFLMFIVSQPDPDFYKNNSAIFLIFSLVLVLVTLFFGKEVNGARRWLDLGFFTLQTSEIIKIDAGSGRNNQPQPTPNHEIKTNKIDLCRIIENQINKCCCCRFSW